MKKFFLSFALMLASLSMSAQTSQSHTVQRGETIESVAQKYGITVADLQKANPDTKEYFYAGMKLMIPVLSKKEQAPQAIYNNDPLPIVSSNDYANKSANYSQYENGTNIYEGEKFECIIDMQVGYLILDDDVSKYCGDFPFGLRLNMGARYNVDETFGVDAMIGYSGMIIDSKTSQRDTYGDFNYHFITLPVRLNAKLVKDVSFYFGPRFDFMVAAKHKVGKNSYSMSDMKKASDDFKTTFTYLDLGLKIKGFNVSYSFALDGKKKLCSGIISIGWGM